MEIILFGMTFNIFSWQMCFTFWNGKVKDKLNIVTGLVKHKHCGLVQKLNSIFHGELL